MAIRVPWTRIEIREIRVPFEGAIRVPVDANEIREIRVSFEGAIRVSWNPILKSRHPPHVE